MNIRLVIALVSMFAAAACGVREGSQVEAPVVRPDQILDFSFFKTIGTTM